MFFFKKSPGIYSLEAVLRLYDSSYITKSVRDYSGLLIARKRGNASGKVHDEVHLEGAKYFFLNNQGTYEKESFVTYRLINGNPTLVVHCSTYAAHAHQHLTPILILGRENFGFEKNRAYFMLNGKKIFNSKAISKLAGEKVRQKYACVYEYFNGEQTGQLLVFDFKRRVEFLEDMQTSFSLGEIPPCASGVVQFVPSLNKNRDSISLELDKELRSER